MGKPIYQTAGHQHGRRETLDVNPFCVHCGRPASIADHQPPLALHDHIPGSGCCVLVSSCKPCSDIQGGEIRNMLRPKPGFDRLELIEPAGFDPDHAIWDRAPWLYELRDVPDNGTWPRLMTAPHPRACDSLGPAVEAWCTAKRGRPWRWWQRLVAYRLFEVDDQRRLVWETLLLSLARQLGKTWLLADLCSWRFHAGDYFGTPQTVLSTGKDVAIVKEMQRPARMAAKATGFPYKSREVNGQEEVELLTDGSRWMCRSKEGVYGNTCDMCTVDEAWKVKASVLDDGVIPTMVERDQSQLLLISTSHRQATALMIGRRATALDYLEEPGDATMLLIEWSSPRGELDDIDHWRLASPHWTDKRERVIAERLAAAKAGESDDIDEPDPLESFRCQWLNQWPAKRIAASKGEEIVEPSDWETARCETDSTGPLVIGVEDHLGHGSAVAFCGTLPDERWVLGGGLFDNKAAAYNVALQAASSRPGSILVVGASLAGDPELEQIPVDAIRKSGSAETGPALAGLRDLLATGRVVQDGSAELAAQLFQARVTVGQRGLMLIPKTRSDLLRAAVWALRIAATQTVPEPAIH